MLSLIHIFIEAAEDLGAPPRKVFARVVIPLSLPGVVSGITMVFMPAVTTFAISRLLGNGMIYLIGDAIENYFITFSNRNVGSALSLVLMVLIIISIGLLRKACLLYTSPCTWAASQVFSPPRQVFRASASRR